MATPSKNGLLQNLRLEYIQIGTTAVLSQILIMRELISLFSGNELSVGIMLAVWLLWTAVGSGVVAKFVIRIKKQQQILITGHFLTAIALPGTLYLCRVGFSLIGKTPGESISLALAFLFPLVVLCPYCILLGMLFTISCQLLTLKEEKNQKTIVGSVYFQEGIGAVFGGLLANFLLTLKLTPFQISALLSLPILLLLFLQPRVKKIKKLFWRLLLIPVGLAIFCGLWLTAGYLEHSSIRQFWYPVTPIQTIYSKFGVITTTQQDATYSFFQNNAHLLTTHNKYHAESTVHIPLLQHRNPQNILVLGGGVSGIANEILKYKNIKHIDYVELNPLLINQMLAVLPEGNLTQLADPRLELHFCDSRSFVKQSGKKYDVIISSLPDPTTIQLNRYYTVEFFHEIDRILAKNGLFSFSVSSSENYISPELAEYLQCFYFSLKTVMPHVTALPGYECLFMASGGPEEIILDVATLLERLKQRNIETTYVNQYYLPYRLAPDRIQELNQIWKVNTPPILNHDFRPIAFYFDVTLWNMEHYPKENQIFTIINRHKNAIIRSIFMAVVVLLAIFWQNPQKKKPVLFQFSVVGIGFTEMGLNVGLILAFQALFGYAYQAIALLTAGYMAGLALGGWWGRRQLRKHPDIVKRMFLKLQLGMVFLPTIYAVTLILLQSLQRQFSGIAGFEFIFWGMLLIAGFFGGGHFTIASGTQIHLGINPATAGGRTYAADLVGSSAGALVASTFLLPLFGIVNTFLFYSILNMIIGFCLIRANQTNCETPNATP